MRQCFVCEREITVDEYGCVHDAGFALVSFHFGSRHDQCGGHFDPRASSPDPIDKLLRADEIEFLLCDDCFEKKFHLGRGYRVRTKRERTEIK